MTDFAVFGYLADALAYSILTLLLLFGWRGSRLGGLLLLACAISVAWGIVLGIPRFYDSATVGFLLGTETLRSGIWIVFLTAIAGQLGISRALRIAANAVWMGVLILGYTWGAIPLLELLPIEQEDVVLSGGLVVAFAGLLLVEQIYRNTTSDLRWRVQPLALGIGGLFAYDLFMYAQGVMFSGIEDVGWAARGAVNLLFVPFIAIAARRNPRWDLDIFVSRHVVFYTSTLVAVGVYLIVMSLGGYLILLYGGNWGAVLRLVFFVGAILVLLVLMFSNVVRARLKVFLTKHFFRNRYDYRAEWLRLITTLSQFRGRESNETLIQALAEIVESPGGLLWVQDDVEDVLKLTTSWRCDINAPDIENGAPLAAFIRKEFWLIDLEEYAADPDMYGHVDIGDWLAEDERLWLLIPLVTGQRLVGLIGLLRPLVVGELNYEDRDLLKTAGQHIAVHLVQDISDQRLSEARQFEAYNRLTAFLMHDLNNLIAQQSLIVKNAERHKDNPAFVEDAMTTIANSVSRMNGIMTQLRRGSAEAPEPKNTRLKYVVSMAIDRAAAREPRPVANIADADVPIEVDVEHFVMILTHVIRNAQDATPGDGHVEVTAEASDGDAVIRVRDSGEGMSRDFVRNRLFRPFDTTKGSQGMGIGAYQAREFARQLGGDVTVVSAPGEGTELTFRFPLKPKKSAARPARDED